MKMAQQFANDKLVKVVKALDEIREALFDCSREFAKADSDNEWQTAEALFNLAKSADLLRRQITALTNNSPTSSKSSERVTENFEGASQGKANVKPSKKKKEDYPKFSIRNDALVKIGLGRDKRTEYEQTVPKSEYEKIVARLASMTTSHEEFIAEDVQEGLEMPMYQTYTVISVLRQVGLLDLLRRGLYSFHSPKTFSADVKAVWSQIKTQG